MQDIQESRQEETTAALVKALNERFSADYQKAIYDVLDVYGYSDDTDTRKQLPGRLTKAVSDLVRSQFQMIYHDVEKSYYMYSKDERVFLEVDRDALVEAGFAYFEQAQTRLEATGKSWQFLMKERAIKSTIKEGLRPNLGVTDGSSERSILAFKNKVVDLTKNYFEEKKRGGGLHACPEPSADVFYTQTLNANFVAIDQRPAIWETALKTMGFETPEMMDAVEDLLLYLITPSKAREEMFYFYGKGSNGKSVLIKFLTEVVGRRHIAAVSLDDLQKSDFAWEGLLGKRLNLPAESGSSGFMDNEKLKAVITDDAVSINRKNRPFISVVLPVKFVFAANRLPVFAEKTHAMYRRFRLLRFDRVVSNAEKIENFHEKLLASRDEIVSWWLVNHLCRYQKFNPSFSLPEIFEAWRMDAMRGEGDVVAAFVEEMVEFTGSPTDVVKPPDLVKVFKEYCVEENVSTAKWGETVIYRKLLEDFELVSKYNPKAKMAAEGSRPVKIDRETKRYYRGLKVIQR